MKYPASLQYKATLVYMNFIHESEVMLFTCWLACFEALIKEIRSVVQIFKTEVKKWFDTSFDTSKRQVLVALNEICFSTKPIFSCSKLAMETAQYSGKFVQS